MRVLLNDKKKKEKKNIKKKKNMKKEHTKARKTAFSQSKSIENFCWGKVSDARVHACVSVTHVRKETKRGDVFPS